MTPSIRNRWRENRSPKPWTGVDVFHVGIVMVCLAILILLGALMASVHAQSDADTQTVPQDETILSLPLPPPVGTPGDSQPVPQTPATFGPVRPTLRQLIREHLAACHPLKDAARCGRSLTALRREVQ